MYILQVPKECTLPTIIHARVLNKINPLLTKAEIWFGRVSGGINRAVH